VDLRSDLSRLIEEVSKNAKTGLVDPQEIQNLGMVFLSVALLTGENYFFVLSNTMYTLADSLSSFLKVSTMPLSMEYRNKTESLTEEMRSGISHTLQAISNAISQGDKCSALSASAELLKLSYKMNMLTESLKNVVVLGSQGE
jgi:phosphatidate phosphatase APP1